MLMWPLCACVCVLLSRFIYLVLAHYDLELCDPEAPLPKADAGRHGFGMLQPDGDVAIRYRLKKKS